MMAPITTSIEVARSAADAFDYVTDPTRFADWQQSVVSGHMQGDGPHAVGDKCMTTRRVGRGKRAVVSEITHIDPPRDWGVRGTDGPIRSIVDVTVTPLSDAGKSRVTIAVDFIGHGIGKLLVPLVVRPSARKEMPANMERLKQRLEGGA
jgi:Polyketide cyclase / dehydrase and lipid transport